MVKTVSLLIPVAVEEEYLEELLKRVKAQKLPEGYILEKIYVVGSRDVLNKLSGEKVEVIVEEERKGKSHAINLFLKKTSSEILIIQNADVLPIENTYYELLKPFEDPEVGLVGGRAVPMNKPTLLNLFGRSIWHPHHVLNKDMPPKVGEIIAFRNVIEEIPEESPVDEETICALIQKLGFKAVYAPNAIVYNKVPETIGELVNQRKRIFVGHLWLKKKLGYTTPTLNWKRLGKTILSEMVHHPRKIITLLPVILFELSIRFLGLIEFYIEKRDYHKWKQLPSTKGLVCEDQV